MTRATWQVAHDQAMVRLWRANHRFAGWVLSERQVLARISKRDRRVEDELRRKREADWDRLEKEEDELVRMAGA